MIVPAPSFFLDRLNRSHMKSFLFYLLQGVLAKLSSMARALQAMSEVSHPVHSFLPLPAICGTASPGLSAQHHVLPLPNPLQSQRSRSNKTTHKTIKKQHIMESVRTNLDDGDRTGIESGYMSSSTGSAEVRTWCSSSAKNSLHFIQGC